MAEDIKVLSEQMQRLQALSAMYNRMQMSSYLGYQYGGDRDIYDSLGYKKNLSVNDYLFQYLRQDIARAVIDKPVNVSWRGGVKLIESDDDEETEPERRWRELWKGLRLHNKFTRLDKLSGLGRYGILLYGFDDVSDRESFKNPASPNELLYVRPFGENMVTIQEWDENPGSERYGRPVIYQVQMTNPATEQGYTIDVHYSRVLHVPSDLLDSEVFGSPRLEPIFNRLKDLEKIVGGSGEMFWRGARPGYAGEVNPEYQLPAGYEEDLQEKLDEYEHNLRRFIVEEGINFKALETQVADPERHVDVQIQMISSEKGIPKRILTGSERGELASAQDKEDWLSTISARRTEFVEQMILDPFVADMVAYGIMPEPQNEDEVDSYSWKWEDLYAPSEKEKADIGKVRSSALAEYTKQLSNSSMVLPPSLFLQLCLGLSDEEAELIEQTLQGDIDAEVAEQREADRQMREEAQQAAIDRAKQTPNNRGGASGANTQNE